MPTRDPREPQVLTPPKTRLFNAWHNAWQQFYGDGPRKLIRVQTQTIPATRRLAYRHRVRR